MPVDPALAWARSDDPAHAISQLISEVIVDYDERSLSSGFAQLADPGAAARRVVDAAARFEPLVRISCPVGVSELTNTILSADPVRDLVERMLKTSGRRVDLSSPFVDARMLDGSRAAGTGP